MKASGLRAISNAKGSLACSPVIIRTADGRRFEIVEVQCQQVRTKSDKGIETMAGVPVLTILIEELK